MFGHPIDRVTALPFAALLLCLGGAVAAEEPPAPGAQVRVSIPSRPDAEGEVEAVFDNPGAEAQEVEVELLVVDHFQKPVLRENRTISVALGKQAVAFPPFAAVDAKRFRADLRHRRVEGPWLLAHQYAEVDCLASGPRRIQRIDGGPWQRLVLAESAPGEPAYPPAGDWEPTPFPLKPQWSATSHWTWFRQAIPPQPWLNAPNIEVRFAQVDYHCHVYLNGHRLGSHMVALTPFAFDLSDRWRQGQPNVLEIAVGDMSTTHADLAKDGSFNMITPSVGTGGVPGIWEGVYLLAHGPVHLEDVFVIPSVMNQALTVRTWLRNSAAQSARLLVGHQVEDEGRPVLALPDEAITLEPGEARVVETTRPWHDPRLWWPHSPHLYRLRTRLSIEGGCVDELSTRFGFREVRIEGPNLLLNGRIFRPFGFTTAGEGPGIRQPSRDILEWWWNRKKMDRPWLIRLHVQVRPGWYAEVADEMGVCLEPETSFLSTVFYDFTDPRLWANTIRHARDLVVRDRNCPSVIYWSAGNEVILAAGASKTPLPDYIGGCKQVIAAMKEADPTRPVIYEGGMDETAEMIDLHYPRGWYRHADFPNSAWWLKPGVLTESFGGQTPVFPWMGDRPVTIGEEGQLFTTEPPHDMATFMGDEAYLEPPGYAASARFRAIDDMIGATYIEGYRRSGVVRISPDCGASSGPRISDAMKLVRTFITPRDEHFLARSTIDREVTIFHDVLVPDTLQFAWRVAGGEPDAGRIIAEGSHACAMDAGEVRHLRISWQAPEVAQPTRITLQTTLTGTAGEIFTERQEYRVHPLDPPPAPAAASIGLYDPNGATARALSELGAGVLKRVESLSPDSLAGLAALVLGEDLPAEPQGAAESLASLTESGGKVILLRQQGQTGLRWAPLDGLVRTAGLEHTYCFARDHAHPLLAGIDDGLLRLWSEDHVVCRDALLKVGGHNAVAVVDAGGPGASGLCYAPVLEIALPRGSWVLCQLLLAEKSATHPGARRFLRNLLEYAAAPPHRTVAPLGLLAGEGSVVTRLLADLGVVTHDVAHAGLGQVRAVVVDDQGIGAQGVELRRFAEQGGTVLVKGLTPATHAGFRDLLPQPLDLVADDLTRRPVQAERDPLTSGISNEDLYWERRTKQFAFGPQDFTGVPVYGWLIRPGPGMKLLYRTEVRDHEDKPAEPRGAGLVRIPVGEGWIVVDQTRWEAAYEPQPEVWGNRTPFATGLRRYVAMLLTNLGGQQR